MTTLKVDWCEVLGSDCHSFRGATGHRDRRYTWVKMETPSLEGLRLALMDGAKFSIRRSDEPQPVTLPEHFVEAIEIENARFMGARSGCQDRVQSAAQRSGRRAWHRQVYRGARVENRGSTRG